MAFKAYPTFFGEGVSLYGVKVEIDDGEDKQDAAGDMLKPRAEDLISTSKKMDLYQMKYGNRNSPCKSGLSY